MLDFLKLAPRLSDDVRAELAKATRPDGPTAFDVAKCSHCGGVHMHACPRVKRLTFTGSNLTEVEFWPDGQWSTKHVIWPWEVFTAPPLPPPEEQPPVRELVSPPS